MLRQRCSRRGCPLKVMMFYQDFGVMGGIERYLLQTCQLLLDDPDFQPVVICTKDGPLYRQLQAMGVTVYGLANRPFFSKSFWRSLDIFSLLSVSRILKPEKPDLLHVHIGIQENILLKKLGVPVVYTYHGYGTLFSLAGVKNPIKRAFKLLSRKWFQQTANHMDALLVVSETERQRLQDEGYLSAESRAQVVHNGLAIEEWQTQVQNADREALRQQWRIPPEADCVAYFNRLDANKCPLDFVALAQTLTQQALTEGKPLPHFLMAGAGPLETQVRQASADLDNFRYMGYCQDIPGLLAVADVVVHPAALEGFGLGVVEVMAAGVPVVTYDSGGPREILQTPDTAHLLVPVRDIDALAYQVSTLLSASPAEEEMLKIALQQRASHFSLERFQENLTRVYHRLLPTVSVILPVFNGEETVLRAVRSVLNQTYPHLELIVVDDGSTDETLATLETIQDDRLRILSQANQGVAVARNFAFQHAQGDWIAFIDADDVWLPEKLASELQTVRQNTSETQPACLVYSGYFAVNDQDVLIHKPSIFALNGDLSQAVLQHEGLFLPSTSLVHRTIFETVGGFKPGCYHEDRVFFIEACRQFPAFATNERLVVYRQSLSGRCRSVLRDYDKALNAELSIVETLRSTLSKAELAELADLQKRNLLYRFLMYNYLAHAVRLGEALRSSGLSNGLTWKRLFSGNKGRLAQWSLGTKINFMFAARLFIQGFTQTVIAPAWSRQIKNRLGPGLLDIRRHWP